MPVNDATPIPIAISPQHLLVIGVFAVGVPKARVWDMANRLTRTWLSTAVSLVVLLQRNLHCIF